MQILSKGTAKALAESAARYRRRGQVTSVVVPLTIGSNDRTVKLRPIDIRAPGYTAEYTDRRGRHLDPTEVELFEGEPISPTISASSAGKDFIRLARIRGSIPGSGSTRRDRRARYLGLLRTNGHFYSLSSTDDSPATIQIEASDPKQLASLVARCGAIHGASTTDSGPGNTNSGDIVSEGISAEGLRETEIATEADYEYFSAAKSTSASNAEILAILNGVSGIYQSTFGVSFRVVYQHTWTIPGDPYSTTDGDGLLSEFRTYWEANRVTAKAYDVAHLFTGRDLDHDVVGVAYLGSVCSSLRYGLSQRLSSTYSTQLAAHEIGHNFGMQHDSCTTQSRFLMCPFLVAGATTFSPVSISAARSLLASDTAACITAQSGGGSPPPQHAPVLAPIGSQSIAEGQTLTLPLIASDEDGNPIIFSVSPAVEGLSIAGTSMSYTPSYGAVTGGASSSVVTITVTATDSTGLSDSETVPITVLNVNRAPTIVTAAEFTVAEGEMLRVTPTTGDADGEVLRLAVVGDLPQGAVLDHANRTVFWRPAGNQSGSYSVVLSVTDPFGAVAYASFTVSVTDSTGNRENPLREARLDLSGDGLSDLVVFRPSTGEWFGRGTGVASFAAEDTQVPFGLFGDVPVPADYDGDHITDEAVYRMSGGHGVWLVRYSNTGIETATEVGTGIPAPADYDGDGRSDPAIFAPVAGQWTVFFSTHNVFGTFSGFGDRGDIPLPCDRSGDGKAELILFRPSFRQWYVRDVSTGKPDETITLGERSSIPLVGNFVSSSRCSIAVFEPKHAEWIIEGENPIEFGLAGDIPVPLDIGGSGIITPAVFRPSNAHWYVRADDNAVIELPFGLSSDLPPGWEQVAFALRTSGGAAYRQATESHSVKVADPKRRQLATMTGQGTTVLGRYQLLVGDSLITGDYDGDQRDDTALIRSGRWEITLSSGGGIVTSWGRVGDAPVPGDFDNDGVTDIAVYRADSGDGTGEYLVHLSSSGENRSLVVGGPGSIPVPGDYNGDGYTDAAVWNPSLGVWTGRDGRSDGALPATLWGSAGDLPMTADLDRDGRADHVIWRPAEARFYVRYGAGYNRVVPWGSPGDEPFLTSTLSVVGGDFGVYRRSQRQVFLLSGGGAVQILAHRLDKRRAALVGLQPPRPLTGGSVRRQSHGNRRIRR